ncbi:hypothetical protein [Clostridium sardiniense]|uniref:hypothetical protein n=1 Tax=Clostridium sardiniense TaxID=29369 RepID=UPI00195F1021|nr:hypothetical protein [Clostridium sardiniense]MBM7836458.1 hypothetical protein [Clostridium sardiniense]
MKVGVRKPSLKKSLSARTTGRITREIKKSVNPVYGKKGMGWVNDPEKAMYNKAYNKTTVSAKDVANVMSNGKIDSSTGSIKDIFKMIGATIELIILIAKTLFYLALFILFVYILFKIIF